MQAINLRELNLYTSSFKFLCTVLDSFTFEHVLKMEFSERKSSYLFTAGECRFQTHIFLRFFNILLFYVLIEFGRLLLILNYMYLLLPLQIL